MSRTTVILEFDNGDAEQIRSMLRAFGFDYSELAGIFVKALPREPEHAKYQVRLKTGLGVWLGPGYGLPKITGQDGKAITYRAGHVHYVFDEQAGWLSVAGGWIPNKLEWVERI